jgi:Zn-dependent peptidase ImmA (M78 family)
MALKPRYTLASKIAEKLLLEAKVTYPPVDVKKLVDHLKLKLLPYKFPDHVSAVLMKVDSITVIGVNQEHAPQRQNFSIAHEIGHFMLGHHIDFIIDFEEVGESRYDTEHSNKIQEQEANHFASELLMPGESIKKDFSALRDAKAVAKKYGVSEQALWIKLIRLKLV